MQNKTRGPRLQPIPKPSLGLVRFYVKCKQQKKLILVKNKIIPALSNTSS